MHVDLQLRLSQSAGAASGKENCPEKTELQTCPANSSRPKPVLSPKRQLDLDMTCTMKLESTGTAVEHMDTDSQDSGIGCELKVIRQNIRQYDVSDTSSRKSREHEPFPARVPK